MFAPPSTSGRNIDLGIIAMNHVVDWAIIEKWLPEDFRKPTWKPMADAPAEDRLMEPEGIDKLCKAALLDKASLKMLDPRVRHLRAAQAISGQNFQDYLRLLQWAGAREQKHCASDGPTFIGKRMANLAISISLARQRRRAAANRRNPAMSS